MFITTQGVVLRSYPFKDNKSIAKIFTSDEGLLSFIIKKTKNQIILSQPFTIAEITYKKQKNSALFHVKDVHVDYAYRDLLFNNEKLRLVIVLSEILQKCLNEKNVELYKLIITAFKWLDQANQNYSGFNNLFLIKFCQIAGIAPYTKLDVEKTINQQLDIQSGLFVETQKIKLFDKHIIPIEESVEIDKLSKLNFTDLNHRLGYKKLDNSIFNYLIQYISIHFADVSSLKSTRILKEIF